jgi:hypothetical protein
VTSLSLHVASPSALLVLTTVPESTAAGAALLTVAESFGVIVVLPGAVMVAVNVSTVDEPAAGEELATSKLQVKD